MNKHFDITIEGKVQGVYFRSSTKAVADILGLKGTVMNLPNGNVFIEAEGSSFELNELITFCKEGPEKAVVTNLDFTEGEMKNYKHFEIKKK